MLEKIMFWAILGHFIGDYLLQSKKMALTKSSPGLVGIDACVMHCCIYSLTVFITVAVGVWGFFGTRLNTVLWIFLMVFLTHYPIDRWSLGDKWLKWIKGRRRTDGAFDPEYKPDTQWAIAALAGTQAFAAIVYTVVDNTMHIVLMAAGFAALLYCGVI